MRISDWSSDVCSSDLAAECRAGGQAPAHLLQCKLRLPDDPHAMVDAAGAQPSLSDLEPPPFAQQDILCGHANVVEFDLGVAVRRVVETHDRKVSQHPDTRRLRWHQDHRLLTIGVGRSEEHTSELQSLMRISYAVFCL